MDEFVLKRIRGLITILFLLSCLYTPGRGDNLPLGKVVRVDTQYNFIILDLGRDEGIEKGDIFSIYRGGEELGQVKVIRVGKKNSAADIIKLRGDKPSIYGAWVRLLREASPEIRESVREQTGGAEIQELKYIQRGEGRRSNIELLKQRGGFWTRRSIRQKREKKKIIPTSKKIKKRKEPLQKIATQEIESKKKRTLVKPSRRHKLVEKRVKLYKEGIVAIVQAHRDVVYLLTHDILVSKGFMINSANYRRGILFAEKDYPLLWYQDLWANLLGTSHKEIRYDIEITSISQGRTRISVRLRGKYYRSLKERDWRVKVNSAPGREAQRIIKEIKTTAEKLVGLRKIKIRQ